MILAFRPASVVQIREVLPILHFSKLSFKMASTLSPTKKHRVAVIGSGNWGSTISKIVAENTRALPALFEEKVQMWVHEEEVAHDIDHHLYDAEIGAKPQKLSTIINKHHENTKYLPGVRLPDNLIANPDVIDAAKDASILIFNLPHQFIGRVCSNLKGNILPYARGISCIKGVNVSDDGIALFSEWIGDGLGIYCGALSGANIASEIAHEKWSETTIAYNSPAIDLASSTPGTPITEDLDYHFDARGKLSSTKLTGVPAEYPLVDHALFKNLFHRPYFHVRVVRDVAGVSLSGALKNIVALAAGFVDGRGWGDNAKAAIMRVGLLEMVKFGKTFFGKSVHTGTFTEESAGVADLITSCSGGRNFRCAKKAIQQGLTVQEIERLDLNGQMLQGTSTAKEVNSFLKAKGLEQDYPLFTAVYGILEGRHSVDDIPVLVSEICHT